MARLQATGRCDRRVLASLVVVLCGIAACFLWLARPMGGPPTTAEIMAREATQPAEIAVGPNVQVSAANGTISHRELQVAAHPTDPLRLFAAAILLPDPSSPLGAVSGY